MANSVTGFFIRALTLFKQYEHVCERDGDRLTIYCCKTLFGKRYSLETLIINVRCLICDGMGCSECSSEAPVAIA